MKLRKVKTIAREMMNDYELYNYQKHYNHLNFVMDVQIVLFLDLEIYLIARY